MTLRIALRQLAQSPAFTVFAVLTLALGIGATTAIFSVIEGVLLRPLGYPAAAELVTIAQTVQGEPVRMSPVELDDVRAQGELFSAVAGTLEFPCNLTGGDRPERLEALCVSPSYFSLLGVAPRAGRVFGAADNAPGIAGVTVISEDLWQRRFGGADVLGKSLAMDDDPYIVVGVMPRDFRHPSPATAVPIDMWVPCGYAAMPFDPPRRRGRVLETVVGRLAPGVTPAHAQRRLAEVAAEQRRQYPGDYESPEQWGVQVQPLAAVVVGGAGRGLLLLFAAVGLVLLIACTNVAILLMARAARRQKELTVRAALGATRARLTVLLLTESLLLAMLGGAGGLLLAAIGTRALVALSPSALPRSADIHVDLGLLAFTGGLSGLAALIFGLLPALRASRPDLQAVLNEAGRTASAAPARRLRRLLVAAEVALATVLLVTAGLVMRSLRNAQNVAPGFDGAGVTALRLWLPLPNDRSSGTYNDAGRRAAFGAEVLRRARTLPGVEAAALAAHLPLEDAAQRPPWRIAVLGRGDGAARAMVLGTIVSDGYFETLRVPLVAGRTFQPSDAARAPPVAIVSRALAGHLWPGGDALGARVRVQELEQGYLVVGVVGDVHSVGLDVAAPDELYLTHAQNATAQLEVVVRAAPGSGAALAVPDTVRAIDAHLPVSRTYPLGDLLVDAVARRRFVAWLLALFAGAALAMAALGIYGVTTYEESQRRHEIGLRMALGARARDVMTMILLETAAVVGSGVAVGLAVAAAVGRMVGGLLYGVGPLDAPTFAAIAGLLAGVALVAAWLPARRAARVDPMVALRES